MSNSALVGLSRQVALGRELDVVANNIANMNTTGFKADGSIFEEYLSPTARTPADSKISFVRDRGTWHDMTQGPTQHTGNPLDVAIDGKGFLVVQTPRGERYTRNGSLQIGPTGNLMTADGFPIVGDSGPITLQPTDRQISIAEDGTVSVREGTSTADTQRGKLRVVSFDDAQRMRLTKDGSGTFAAPAGVTPQPETNVRVIQGAVEKSNVRGVVEITRMIEITRSYTQLSAMLQQQSDMRTNAIGKLADVPA
ncbi:MAG TPA: flagellar basal-body rod protein FlgF [Pseudolabrys sp.]|jgi:flagellar basal-body rod protein FlgF|nr:flagellar basal-body rod protein FlgF [Pseudolabrys sp.]